MLRYDVSLGGEATEEAIWRLYYPEIEASRVLDPHNGADSRTFEVLLLGGSVLEEVSVTFENELRRHLPRPVRVFDLCKSAHTSRDSAIKFAKLQGRRFDWIVIYHGINDARMNCCADSVFRDDYTHCRSAGM